MKEFADQILDKNAGLQTFTTGFKQPKMNPQKKRTLKPLEREDSVKSESVAESWGSQTQTSGFGKKFRNSKKIRNDITKLAMPHHLS